MSPIPTLQRVAMVRIVLGASLLCLATVGLAQRAEVQVPSGTVVRLRQLSPLSTSFNRKGDLVSARILDPPSMAGGFLEGEISEVRDGDKGPRIEFEFHTLYLAGQSIAVAATPLDVTNSKGATGVDESGSAIDGAGRGSGGKASSFTSRISRSSGFRLTTKAAHLTLAVGSAWTVQVQSHKR